MNVGDLMGKAAVRFPNHTAVVHKKPEATAETLRGGWLHTRDVGSMDEDVYIY